jgi:serine/threonine-protein kinase
VARSAHSGTVTGAGEVVGTALYIAPEQVARQETGPAADVYALGALAYHCLAGQPPFQGRNPIAIALQHLDDDPPPLPDDIPAEVRAIVRTALSKDPADRFPSAGVMAQAAESAVTSPDTSPNRIGGPIIPTNTTGGPGTPADTIASTDPPADRNDKPGTPTGTIASTDAPADTIAGSGIPDTTGGSGVPAGRDGGTKPGGTGREGGAFGGGVRMTRPAAPARTGLLPATAGETGDRPNRVSPADSGDRKRRLLPVLILAAVVLFGAAGVLAITDPFGLFAGDPKPTMNAPAGPVKSAVRSPSAESGGGIADENPAEPENSERTRTPGTRSPSPTATRPSETPTTTAPTGEATTGTTSTPEETATTTSPAETDGPGEDEGDPDEQQAG